MRRFPFVLIFLTQCLHGVATEDNQSYYYQQVTRLSDTIREAGRVLLATFDGDDSKENIEVPKPVPATGTDSLRRRILDQKLYRWREQLFPNTTLTSTNGLVKRPMRRLGIDKGDPWSADDPVPCVTCTGLQTCSILNQLLVEEKYYPNNPELRETCLVIEDFGRRISGEIFGNGRTFRDTPQCRDVVMQYLCLFYGSDNPMYRNYCEYQEIIEPLEGDTVLAPKPPCKSFCVQISTVCANDPEFIQICNDIACPPVEETCTPDPQIDGVVLAANLGCDVPYYRSPYNTASHGHHFSATAVAVVAIVTALLAGG